MSEPTPIDRAEALIRANPREYAAYKVGAEREAFNSRDIEPTRLVNASAAYLLLAETPPTDPTKVYTRDECRQLTRRHSERVAALLDALTYAERDLDADGRAMAEGAVQAAARALAGLVGR